jgi:phage terminase small subunit
MPAVTEQTKKRGPRVSARQRLFVQEYLVDLSPGLAAARAGYKIGPRSKTPYTLMRNPNVANMIAAAMRERGKNLRLDADEVLQQLLRIAMSDITEVVQWTADGRMTMTAADEIPGHVRPAIQHVKIKRRRQHDDVTGETAIVEEFDVRMIPKVDSLRLLAQHLGLVGPKIVQQSQYNFFAVAREKLDMLTSLSLDELKQLAPPGSSDD